MSASKINVAKQAMEFIQDKLTSSMVVGIGTGSTVNCFIDELGESSHSVSYTHLTLPTKA